VKAVVDLQVKKAFESLEEMYNPKPAHEAELVYTVRGREKVLTKIYEMIACAAESIVLVAPTTALEDARLLELLEGALARGVEVKAVGDEGAAGMLPPGTEIRTGTLVAVDLLVDGKAALISLPDYTACGWIDSPAVASHFKQFLDLLWSASSPS
jgi:phosphatidylserine/phosphatidylglycerophosphate/cardiolipin synthase-like enzyme